MNDAGTPTTPSWRMAEQYFRDSGVEIQTKPHNDGYVMTVQQVRQGEVNCLIYFDPAGRITHIRTI